MPPSVGVPWCTLECCMACRRIPAGRDWSEQCQGMEGGYALAGRGRPRTGQGVEMPPSVGVPWYCLGAPSSLLLFVARHAEESQQGGTGQNNVREWKEGMHLLEGADPGTGQDVEGHSMAVNLGQRKRAQMWLLCCGSRT